MLSWFTSSPGAALISGLEKNRGCFNMLPRMGAFTDLLGEIKSLTKANGAWGKKFI